jgi:hypothetical protein
MPTSFRLADPDALAADLDGVLPREGGLVVFEGVAEPDAVAACDALARRRRLRFHHEDARELVAPDFSALRGNVREAFDEPRDAAVLLFTNAAALLDAAPRARPGEPRVPPPPERFRRYLFDRIAAFDGVVALAVDGPAEGLDVARTRGVVVTP